MSTKNDCAELDGAKRACSGLRKEVRGLNLALRSAHARLRLLERADRDPGALRAQEQLLALQGAVREQRKELHTLRTRNGILEKELRDAKAAAKGELDEESSLVLSLVDSLLDLHGVDVVARLDSLCAAAKRRRRCLETRRSAERRIPRQPSKEARRARASKLLHDLEGRFPEQREDTAALLLRAHRERALTWQVALFILREAPEHEMRFPGGTTLTEGGHVLHVMMEDARIPRPVASGDDYAPIIVPGARCSMTLSSVRDVDDAVKAGRLAQEDFLDALRTHFLAAGGPLRIITEEEAERSAELREEKRLEPLQTALRRSFTLSNVLALARAVEGVDGAFLEESTTSRSLVLSVTRLSWEAPPEHLAERLRRIFAGAASAPLTIQVLAPESQVLRLLAGTGWRLEQLLHGRRPDLPHREPVDLWTLRLGSSRNEHVEMVEADSAALLERFERWVTSGCSMEL